MLQHRLTRKEVNKVVFQPIFIWSQSGLQMGAWNTLLVLQNYSRNSMTYWPGFNRWYYVVYAGCSMSANSCVYFTSICAFKVFIVIAYHVGIFRQNALGNLFFTMKNSLYAVSNGIFHNHSCLFISLTLVISLVPIFSSGSPTVLRLDMNHHQLIKDVLKCIHPARCSISNVTHIWVYIVVSTTKYFQGRCRKISVSCHTRCCEQEHNGKQRSIFGLYLDWWYSLSVFDTLYCYLPGSQRIREPLSRYLSDLLWGTFV